MQSLGAAVDFPGVRFVHILTLPPTVERLLQAGGRAGRDGAAAYVRLLAA